MSRKLLICPWFGEKPDWWVRYCHNIVERLIPQGYDFYIEEDLAAFKGRVRGILDLECPIVPGGTKIHDYRPVLGDLYQDELEGYDWWGHTDFDCVYGRIEQFVTDELLDGCDIQTDNGHDYLCGPWTLYRRGPTEQLYRKIENWRTILAQPETTAWVETSFSVLAQATLRVQRDRFHRHTEPQKLRRSSVGALFWGDEEISFFHFRYSKQWPL